ncbi:ATP-binding cassette domain-containing protein [Tistrella mobilis]|uniref:ATP-binding cassette domain-containing protein n=1 Tax=Tistrella mobilis TaxID=171437 RepID=UPI0031F60744
MLTWGSLRLFARVTHNPRVLGIPYRESGSALIGITWLATSRTRGHLDAAIDADQQVAQVFGNVIGAVEAVRQVGGTAWTRDHHQRQMYGLLDRWAAYCRRRIAYAAIYGVALALLIAITFALLLPAWRAGQLTIGEVVLYNTLLLQLNQPLEAAGHVIDDVVRSLTRLRPLLRMWQAPEMPIRLHAQPLVIRDGAVTFDHLGYVHADGRGLSGLRATARRGHVTWIMGETGAGKTTFMRLLTRALEPGTGRIRTRWPVAVRGWQEAHGLTPGMVVSDDGRIVTLAVVDGFLLIEATG